MIKIVNETSRLGKVLVSKALLKQLKVSNLFIVNDIHSNRENIA